MMNYLVIWVIILFSNLTDGFMQFARINFVVLFQIRDKFVVYYYNVICNKAFFS